MFDKPSAPDQSLNSAIAAELDDFIIAHSTTPNIKLYYPEPFIASPTFNHDDIWFLHIVIYQYWLWFFFCFMIIFFFLSFLITIRWCNIRHRPSRETRGVSRSKCGDLITATVPVSWAASIIIHESTDAIEVADGFGTSEMAIGIRAYQWGWEYYYPKDLDVMFRRDFTTLKLGNSVNYWSDSSFKSGKTPFKFNLYNSDVVDLSQNSYITYNNSVINWSTTSTLSDFTFGPSRLISRLSNNLITSPKLYSLNESLLIKPNSSQTSEILNSYLNYFFNDTFAGNFKLRSSVLNNTSSSSIFYHNHNFLNFRDLNKFNTLTPSSNSNLSGWDFSSAAVIPSPTTFSLPDVSNLTSHVTKDFIVGPSLTCFLSKTHLYSFLFNKLMGSENLWFYQYADLDFKRWSALELLEDSLGENLFSSERLLTLFKDTKSNQISDSKTSIRPIEDLLNYCTSGVSNTTSLYLIGQTFSNTLSKQIRFICTNLQYSNTNSVVNLTDYLRKDMQYISLETSIRSDLGNSYFTYKNSQLASESMSPNLWNFTNYFNLRSFRDTTKDFFMYSPLQDQLLLASATSPIHNSLNTLNPGIFKFPTNLFNSLEGVNSISTYYQSYWKVFKTTVHEERSHFNLNALNLLKQPLPVISNPKFSTLGSLTKLTSYSFNPRVFKQAPFSQTPQPLNLDFLWSYFTYKFPFSVAFESDVIRYSWFDWYSLRNQRVTKALDTSTFNLYGVKDYDYNFSSGNKVKFINQVDNFFVKYAQARKLYSPLFIYKPYFFSKHNDWTSLTLLFPSNIRGLAGFKLLSLLSNTLPLSVNGSFNHPHLDLNFSFTALHNKIYPTSATFNLNQTDCVANLADTLSRKDYILNYVSTASDSNVPYTYVDSTKNAGFSNVLTYLKSVTEFKVSDLVEPLLGDSSELRNPYQPMKKGISHMIRIQADKAIAMPTDTRLQLLAVSKDIIHSWSIPSAGVKIDCIPGYSSHRICIFTLSGIYWGQCMEICGRFHHWMPIVVYFLRRDLFCIWCIHFIFTDKQFSSALNSPTNPNSGLKVAMDFSTWSYEL
jgi:heme/copper-type cytochrome/quinol oxidase subunit 2